MKSCLITLFLVLLLVSCSRTPEVTPTIPTPGDNPSQTGTNIGTGSDVSNDNPTNPDVVSNPIFQTEEFKSSLKALKTTKNNLILNGHILPQGQIDSGVEEINWISHKIEVEVSIDNYKLIDWAPGFVVDHYRDPDPLTGISLNAVYKFIDNNSIVGISNVFNNFLDKAESFYTSYKDDIGESDKKLLELQFSLVESTQMSYENFVADQNERAKIKTMTWSEILEEYKIKDIVLCDKRLDLINVSELNWAEDQTELNILVKEGKVRSLKNDSRDLFDKNKVFKVYDNYLIYIK